MIPEGKYTVRPVGATTKESAAGNLMVVLDFRIDGETARYYAVVCKADQTINQKNVERLARTFPKWSGAPNWWWFEDNINDVMATDVRLSIRHELSDDGKMRHRIAWIDAPSAGGPDGETAKPVDRSKWGGRTAGLPKAEPVDVDLANPPF